MSKYSNHIDPIYKLNQGQAYAMEQYKKYVSSKIYNHEKIDCKICNRNDFNIILDKDS